MAGKKRRAGRELADLLAAYGVLPLSRALTYPEYCGLVLNVPRVRLQQAVAVANGIAAALSVEDLDPAWADAVAPEAESAAEIHLRMVFDRLAARVKGRIGR